MTVGDDLFAAVCDSPDDDEPRLRYADHVERSEPEYAELIRLQIERSSRETAERARVGQPSPRERELLVRHRDAWGHYLSRYLRDDPHGGDDPGWRFERGFVAFARIELESFVVLGDRLFAMAPIRHIDLIHAGGSTAPLLSAPRLREGLARLDSLSLRDMGLDDDGAEKLADCAALARCAWVDLRGALSLAHSPHFRRKHAVILHGNPVDPADQGRYDWDGSLADIVAAPAGQAIERELGTRVGCSTRFTTIPPTASTRACISAEAAFRTSRRGAGSSTPRRASCLRGRR